MPAKLYPANGKPNPDPVVSLSRIEAPSVELADPGNGQAGGFVFDALAQAYERVNNHLLRFQYGSGVRTIEARVASGRVKIHDGHPEDPNSTTIVGKVLDAREDRQAGGLVMRGFLSSQNGELAEKMREGVVDELSLEIGLYQTKPSTAPIEQLSDQAQAMVKRFRNGTDKDGNAFVDDVLEYGWRAVGLVSASSQELRALISTPEAIPYADLPMASPSTPWDPDAAAARVREWADLDNEGRGGRWCKASRAYALRDSIGPVPSFSVQIADVINGELTVIPRAVFAALRDLHKLKDEQTRDSIAAHLDRYLQRYADGCSLTTPKPACDPVEDEPSSGTAAPPSGPPPATKFEETVDLRDSVIGEAESQLRDLRAKLKRLRVPGGRISKHGTRHRDGNRSAELR